MMTAEEIARFWAESSNWLIEATEHFRRAVGVDVSRETPFTITAAEDETIGSSDLLAVTRAVARGE